MNVIKIVFSFLSVFSLAAQGTLNSKIDSLEKSLANHPRVDIVKVDILNELAYEIYSRDAKKAFSYGTQSLKMATELKYRKGEATSLWIIGLSYLSSDRKVALDYFQKALDIAERIDDKVGICNYLLAISNILKNLGDVNKSEEYLNKAMAVAIAVNDKRLIIKILFNVSRIQMAKGCYIKAAEQLQKIVFIAKEINDKRMLSNSYSQLGVIYYRQGDECKSLEYTLLALKMDEQLHNKPGIFNRLINIANIKLSQKEYVAALETIQRAFQITKDIKDTMKMSVCLATMGEAYLRMDNPATLHHFQQALELVGENDMSQRINCLTNIGEVYTKQGKFTLAQKSFDEALILAQQLDLKYACCQIWMKMGDLYFIQKQYDRAILNVQKALNLANDIKYLELRQDGYERLSRINAATGDYKSAYLNYTQYKSLNDSLFNDKKIRKLALLESSYKFDKEKQKYEVEKTNHELKIKNQWQIILSLIAVSFLILILLFILYWSNKLKKRVLKLEIENINRELEYSQKEMASATLKLVQNSESDAYCVKMLEDIESNTTEEGRNNVRSLIGYYKSKSIYSNWEEFETLFIKVNGAFYDKLNERFPDLTPNERKLSVFLKLNMNNKDIAQITFQSEEALKKARLRLRKKLGLDRDVNLATFIQSL